MRGWYYVYQPHSEWLLAASLIKIPQCFSHTFCLYLEEINVVIEIAILFIVVWLHLYGICASKISLPSVPLTTFWTWSLCYHDNFSTSQPQTQTYARFRLCTLCHRRKFFLCLLTSLSLQHFTVLVSVLFLFTPVTHLHRSTDLSQINVHLTIFFQKKLCKYVFAHINWGKVSDYTGSESKADSTKSALQTLACYTP